MSAQSSTPTSFPPSAGGHHLVASPAMPHSYAGSYSNDSLASLGSVVGPGAASVGLGAPTEPVPAPQLDAVPPHPGVLVQPLAPYASPPQHMRPPAPFPVYYQQQPQHPHHPPPQPSPHHVPMMHLQQHQHVPMAAYSPQMHFVQATPPQSKGKSLQELILAHNTPSSQDPRPRASSTSSGSSDAASSSGSSSSPEESSPMSPVGTPLALDKLFEAAASVSPRRSSSQDPPMPALLDQLFAAAASPPQPKPKIGSTPTRYAGSNLPSAPAPSALPNPALMDDEEPDNVHDAHKLLAALTNPTASAKKPQTQLKNTPAKKDKPPTKSPKQSASTKKKASKGAAAGAAGAAQTPVQNKAKASKKQPQQQKQSQKVTILKRPTMGVGASAPSTNSKAHDATNALKKMLNLTSA